MPLQTIAELVFVATILLLLVIASVRSFKNRAFIKQVLSGKFGRIVDKKRTFHLLEEINRESDKYAFIPEKVLEMRFHGEKLEIAYGTISYLVFYRNPALNYQKGFFVIKPNDEAEKYLTNKEIFRTGVTGKNYSVLFVSIRNFLANA